MPGLSKAVLVRHSIAQDLSSLPLVDSTLRKLCIFTEIVVGTESHQKSWTFLCTASIHFLMFL